MALRNFDEAIIIMDRVTTNTPSGIVSVWREGAGIQASITVKDGLEIFAAMAQGVKVTGYIVVDRKDAEFIKYNTYIKWVSRDLYLMISNDGIQAPTISSMPIAQFAVEVLRGLPK